MGILDFLKKPKADTTATGMDLPPVPKIEGAEGFPEPKKEGLPPLPDASLPPLPTDFPEYVPPRPKEKSMEPPKVNLPTPPGMQMPPPEKVEVQQKEEEPETFSFEPEPLAPEMPTPEEIEEVMGQEEEEPQTLMFPSTPELPSDDIIPEKIPPLEGLPEPPEFGAEPMPRPIVKSAGIPALPREPIPSEEVHPAYFAPEEPELPKRRAVRGPLFIRSDRFRAIVDDIEQVRAAFKSEDDIFFRMTDVKNSQDQKYEDFRQTLEDMQRKLLFIDRSLFEIK